MLTKVKMSQFTGVNTIADSTNQGFSSVRQCKNFMLRPIGALSMFPAWSSFLPGGSVLDLGFITNIDFLFNGARLLFQSPDGNYWNATPDQNTGIPDNAVRTFSGTPISANQTITSSQIVAFKDIISAPLAGTIIGNGTPGQAIVSGQTPDNTWIGGSMSFTTPTLYKVVGVSGQTVTFELALQIPVSVPFIFYFPSPYNAGNWQFGADQTAMGYFTSRLGDVPYFTTQYIADRAFATGFGMIFIDSASNHWFISADNATGIYAVTI